MSNKNAVDFTNREEYRGFKQLTDEQKSVMQSKCMEIMWEIDDEKDKIKLIKAEIKSKELEFYELSSKLRNGYEEVKGIFEYSDDYENKTRTYFDENGEIVGTERLKPSQQRVFNFAKEA